MELRDYGAVVLRYWKLIVSLTAATFVASLVLALVGPAAYKAEYSLAVSTSPEPRTGAYFTYNNYYDWLAAEYLADDLSRLIESQAFAEDVARVLGDASLGSEVSSATRARKTHRILDVTVIAGSPERALAIAQAQEQVLSSKLGEYLAQLKSDNGQVRMINRPTVGRANTTLGLVLQVGLRTLVGLLAGVGLAFLLNYLDGSVRGRREVEQLLGAQVIGEIPAGTGAA